MLMSFAGMEFVSYFLHRFVYHGLFWMIHKSHHEPRKGAFEFNDIFPTVLAAVTMVLMLYSLSPSGSLELLAVTIGVTMYGTVYFVVHDLYIHRRSKAVALRMPFLARVKKAHAHHHRLGGEPYGLLLFMRPSKEIQEQEGGQ